MKQIIEEAAERYDFEGASREKVFCIGARSDEAKEFHQQGMYSEEEMKLLAWGAWYESGFCPNSSEENFDKWFELNKKKKDG